MKKSSLYKFYKLLALSVVLLLWVVAFSPLDSFCADVTENEAIEIADFWYTMEVDSAHLKLTAVEKKERLNKLDEREIYYFVSATDELLDTYPKQGDVLAYVIKYIPSGYVVVSGEDRIQPVIAFDVRTKFRWDRPDRNFLRFFLKREMPRRWNRVKTLKTRGIAGEPNRNWTKMRAMLREGKLGELREKILSPTSLKLPQAPGETEEPEEVESSDVSGPGGTYVFLDTALWGQGNHYNEVVIAHNGDTSDIPTGCTATAMAIKMRFHKWPRTANESHSYTDNWGDIRYSHSRNFGTTNYYWSYMPLESLTTDNTYVANLMYDCGVAVNMNYEVGNSSAWPSASAMNTFFRYRGTVENTSDHENGLKDSIIAHLPVVICSSSHTVVVCGYRDTLAPYYYMNAGWNGSSNGWYNLDNMPGSDSTIDRSYPYSSPNSYVYVNGNWSGYENGNLQTPYNTILEGKGHVPSNGQLWIKTGVYTGTGNSPVLFDTPMNINAYGGSAVIR